jgi:hypothetical protein
MNSKKEVFLIGRQKSEALSVFVFKQVSFMLPVFFLLNDEAVAKELHQRIATKCRVQLRLLEPIGYIPPAEAEENYYQQLAQKAMVEV